MSATGLMKRMKGFSGCLRTRDIQKGKSSPLIETNLDVATILRKASRNWDGGYAMAGMVGHGDAFVMRDPAGIRPAFYYIDDEVVVVASESPVIQTIFNVRTDNVNELPPASALIIKASGRDND